VPRNAPTLADLVASGSLPAAHIRGVTLLPHVTHIMQPAFKTEQCRLLQ
jgi:hypothetical protein